MNSVSQPTGGPRIRRLIPETGLQAAIWALVGVAVLAPVIPLLYASVQSKPIYEVGRVFTLTPYQELFSDPKFWTAALNTLEFAAMTTVASVTLGATFSVLCNRTDVFGRRVFSPLFIAPLLLPPLGVILGWNALYGQGGYAHEFITETLHIPFELNTVPGMAVLGTAVAVPVVFLICQGALAGLDSSFEDAARSVGSSPMRVLGRITLPMLRPALLNSTLLVFTLAIESLGIPLLLGSATGTDFVASYLYNEWSSGLTPDPPIVSAGAMVLLFCACVLLIMRRRLLGDEARFASVGGSRAPSPTLRLGWPRRLAFGGLLGLYLLATTFAPIFALAVSSFVSQLTPLVAPWRLLTLENWEAIAHGEIARSIVNSVEIATVGALLVTAVVALATAVAERSKFKARASLPFLMLFPRAIPGLIIGIGFFWVYLLVNPPGGAIRNSIWGVMLALAIRSVTLAYLVISAGLASVSTSLDDAARSAGAGWWTTVTRIVLPIIRPALYVSFILLFVAIMNDYDPALFLVTPGNEVMGVTMLETARQGVTGPAAAMAMVQVAITVVAIVIGGRIFSTRIARRSNA